MMLAHARMLANNRFGIISLMFSSLLRAKINIFCEISKKNLFFSVSLQKITK